MWPARSAGCLVAGWDQPATLAEHDDVAEADNLVEPQQIDQQLGEVAGAVQSGSAAVRRRRAESVGPG